MAEKQNPKERLKEITDSIETGIKELFESDKYKSYLQTMSRFHKYSLNNTLLISMQKPDATLVAGFNKWRDGFSRHVKKGEKGIKIIAPTPYKIKEQREKLDPQTKVPVLDASGKVQTEEVEIQIPMYRVVSVFDVSQTYGEPLPTLASNLTGNVEQFEVFMEAIKRTAPVPIEIKPMPDNTDGYYHTEDKRIAIREGMSEVQTVSAAIHEVAHSLLHSKQAEQELQAQTAEKPTPMKPKDRNTEEVEAESISFAVCNYYGIQTAENSLGYIATWSKGKELSELRASLETINKTSSELISGIDKHFAVIIKERGIDIAAETAVPGQDETIQRQEGPDCEPTPDPDKGQITEGGCNISVDGHIGTWYVIDTEVIDGAKYFLLEHEEHGDDAACVIVDSDGKLALDDVWNGFNDLKEHFDGSIAEEQSIEEPVQHDYPMPDPMVSIDDRNAYGYTADELLPLSKERAAELWEQDLPVFLLYQDNTEAMIFDIEEMKEHDGLFGIETADWKKFHNRDKDKDHLPPQEVEAQFLEQTQNAYAIYQLKSGEDLRDYRFEGMERLQSRGLPIEHDNYELVYTAPLTDFSGDKDHALNKLYEQFNINHPSDFKGHSLSVSDIVALKVDGTVSSYYVDRFDFQELPQFLPQINPLETAEKSTEQNYNQIDGILNNQPTVAQLEQDAKSGKPISLMDLLDATRREEKQSVMEQLKTKPPQERKKEKTAPSKGAEMER